MSLKKQLLLPTLIKINYMKKLYYCLIGLFLINPIAAQSQQNQFIENYDKNIKLILQSYHEGIKEPLDAKIFDISNPLYYNFLKGGSYKEYNKEFLAMRFYDDFRVNNQPTSFCFILFDGDKKKQLNSYLNDMFSSVENATFYLTLHELGHCIANHQIVIGKIEKENNTYKKEQIADMFAIAFFLHRKDPTQATAIINNIEKLDKEDVHYNPKELKKFYELFKENTVKIHNMADLFNITYSNYIIINKDIK